MALGKDKNAVQLNANIPAEVDIALERARAGKVRKRQEAVTQALSLWIEFATTGGMEHEEIQEVIAMLREFPAAWEGIRDGVSTWKREKQPRKMAARPQRIQRAKAQGE